MSEKVFSEKVADISVFRSADGTHYQAVVYLEGDKERATNHHPNLDHVLGSWASRIIKSV